jgi:hypothetical protein
MDSWLAIPFFYFLLVSFFAFAYFLDQLAEQNKDNNTESKFRDTCNAFSSSSHQTFLSPFNLSFFIL